MPPSPPRPRGLHPFLEADGPLALAHRGGEVGDGRENTLAAFQDAVDLGYRYLETDLHATRDGVLVAFHDDTLDRVTDAEGSIGARTADELARVRVAGNEPIPRFEELLTSFPGARFNLDLKDDRVLGPFVRRARREPRLLDRVCVGAFDDARLAAARRALGPALCTAAGPREVRLLRVASLLGPLGGVARLLADCLQVPLHWGRWPVVDAPFLRLAARLRLPVHVWTINEPATMHALLDRGVHGLVTDATRTLREVLAARGSWFPGRATSGDRGTAWPLG